MRFENASANAYRLNDSGTYVYNYDCDILLDIDEYPTISLLAYTQFICNFNQIVNSLFNLYEKNKKSKSLICVLKKDLSYLKIDEKFFNKPYSINIAALRNNLTAHLNLDGKCFKIVENNTLSNQKI